MAVTTQSIIDECRIILNDAAGTRFPDSELLGWINEAQRRIVDIDDNAGEQAVIMQLLAGALQIFPSGWLRFGKKAIKAQDFSGGVVGNQIHEASEATISLFNPAWEAGSTSATPEHIMRNPTNERTFYIYPPQPLTPTTIKISVIVQPVDTTVLGFISLNDRYREPMRDMTLGYAFKKEDETQDMAKSGMHFKAAMLALGLDGK